MGTTLHTLITQIRDVLILWLLIIGAIGVVLAAGWCAVGLHRHRRATAVARVRRSRPVTRRPAVARPATQLVPDLELATVNGSGGEELADGDFATVRIPRQRTPERRVAVPRPAGAPRGRSPRPGGTPRPPALNPSRPSDSRPGDSRPGDGRPSESRPGTGRAGVGGAGRAASRPVSPPRQVAQPAAGVPDDSRLATDAALVATHAAAAASQARADWLALHHGRDAAWRAYDAADTEARKAKLAAAFPTSAEPLTDEELAARTRHLHRAAMAAYQRGQLSIGQLMAVLGHRGEWDPTLHPFEQDALLTVAGREFLLAEYVEVTQFERAARQAADAAALAQRSAEQEAFAAALRAHRGRQPADRRPAEVSRTVDRQLVSVGAAPGGVAEREPVPAPIPAGAAVWPGATPLPGASVLSGATVLPSLAIPRQRTR